MDSEIVKRKFKKVENALMEKVWFNKDKWIISTHLFPKKDPAGVTFHVFKEHWFNQNSHGIHIESYLYFDSKKQKKSYLTIHFLHEDTFLGTKVKRIELTRPIIDEVYEVVSAWPGYKFRAGKYGQQPFTLNLDGTSPNFETELTKEVVKLCKLLGPLIDKKLKSLL